MVTAAKWQNPDTTADGKRRAAVEPETLDTLWFNTGTLCNIECAHCYIESSPKNDRLVYLTEQEVRPYLEEIRRDHLGTREIGFTGGEPFLNPEIIPMTRACLAEGFDVLILTNAMKPLKNRRAELLTLKEKFGSRLALRVSLDHYTQEVHDQERGEGSFAKALQGLAWLSGKGFALSVAGRSLTDETAEQTKMGYQALFDAEAVTLDARDARHLVIFPEMNERADLPEITTDCWGILNIKPSSVMCATSRMIVKRKGDPSPSVVACTLLPYDTRFSMGETLKDARRPVRLNHPHCASFCVLGGASCSG
jgi:sulfatase maturation enzyme AslB (radical SAM superfamily)